MLPLAPNRQRQAVAEERVVKYCGTTKGSYVTTGQYDAGFSIPNLNQQNQTHRKRGITALPGRDPFHAHPGHTDPRIDAMAFCLSA